MSKVDLKGHEWVHNGSRYILYFIFNNPVLSFQLVRANLEDRLARGLINSAKLRSHYDASQTNCSTSEKQ